MMKGNPGSHLYGGKTMVDIIEEDNCIGLQHRGNRLQ